MGLLLGDGAGSGVPAFELRPRSVEVLGGHIRKEFHSHHEALFLNKIYYANINMLTFTSLFSLTLSSSSLGLVFNLIRLGPSVARNWMVSSVSTRLFKAKEYKLTCKLAVVKW